MIGVAGGLWISHATLLPYEEEGKPTLATHESPAMAQPLPTRVIAPGGGGDGGGEDEPESPEPASPDPASPDPASPDPVSPDPRSPEAGSGGGDGEYGEQSKLNVVFFHA